jgi:hypothetical protein
MAKPVGSVKTRTASITARTLSSGSPIPMKTMLAMRSPSCHRAIASCATISAPLKLLSSPILPVSQNVQPWRHPT